jgi:hypothetical protein
MSKRFNSLTLAALAILFVITFAVVSAPGQVSAAPIMINSIENSCLSCHEDLYYLHDTGCWYCMTDVHKDRCTDCHEGNATSYKEEEAHLGLLRHPQENDGAKCKQCHTEDFKQRLDTFDAKVGFDPAVETVAYVPAHTVETGFPETEPQELADKRPWAAGAIVLFGFWLALVVFSPKKP